MDRTDKKTLNRIFKELKHIKRNEINPEIRDMLSVIMMDIGYTINMEE